MRLPLNATVGEAVYRQLSPEAFDPQAAWLGRPVQRWTLTLHLSGRREPAARATCARRPDGAWGVAETGARVRYRGMGLGAALRREPEVIWGRAALLRSD